MWVVVVELFGVDFEVSVDILICKVFGWLW